MGLFGGKSYKTSEELSLDACYPKKLPDCLKFVQKTLKKGAPYPGDFTHEKLVVLEFKYLLTLNNTVDKALDHVNLLTENVMPYVVKTLAKKRADDYTYQLPEAYMEVLYDNLSKLSFDVEAEKSAVALVLAHFFIKNKSFDIVKTIPKDLKKNYEFLLQAKKYGDKTALSLIEPKIDEQIKKIEKIL